MAAFVKYNCFVENLAEKVHNLQTDVLKVALTNTAPVVGTHALLADIVEIAAGNGYTAGGNQTTQTSSSQTGGVYSLVSADPATFTASGGTIGPFRYAVLYNSTPTTPLKPLIGYWDYGSSVTLAIGETFTVDLGATTLTIT
jgi:hypothetical protein